MSEPLGDRRKPLDNLLQNTVEEHNQQADELLGVFQRDFPRTYRLLDGPSFSATHPPRGRLPPLPLCRL